MSSLVEALQLQGFHLLSAVNSTVILLYDQHCPVIRLRLVIRWRVCLVSLLRFAETKLPHSEFL